MRLYLSAPLVRRVEVVAMKQQLLDLGHVVTSSWLDSDADKDYERVATLREWDEWALQNLLDLRAASGLVRFTHDLGAHSKLWNTGGFHVELGIAIERCLPIWIVGPRMNVFDGLRGQVRQVKDVDAFLASLDEFCRVSWN